MEYELYESDELAHHGIKGMRWGIRRFQNKDGSLTPAGEKRRAKLEAQIEKLSGSSKKGSSDSDSKDTQTTKKKSINEMSDNELASAINRARMEDAYRQLRPEPINEKHPMMKKLVSEVVMPAAISSGKQFLQNALTKAGENMLKGKVDPNSIDALRKTAERLELQNRINKLKKNEADEPDWGNMLKKQQYDRNKKKYADEDAAAKKDKADREAAAKKAEADREAAAKAAAEQAKKDRAAESRRNRNDVLNEFVSRAREDTSTRRESKWESVTKNLKDEINFDSYSSVDAFVSNVSNKKVSDLASPNTRKRVQTQIENGDFDFTNWGRYDLNVNRWDDE